MIRFVEPALDRRSRDPVRAVLGCAYALAGRLEEAEELAADNSSDALNQAQIFACIGDKDRTFEALDRAAAAGPIRIGWILNEQKFALLRGDPRLKALRNNVRSVTGSVGMNQKGPDGGHEESGGGMAVHR